MRVVFMGTPQYATAIFQKIQDRVVGLFTQPDRPVGRKRILTPPHIKKYVMERGVDIPIFQPQRVRDPEVVAQIEALRPDFIVVAAYGQILPPQILSIAPCINLHGSLLPKYRGASPVQQALLNGDSHTGVTAMLMDEGLDTGDILAYEVVPIQKDDTAATLFEKLSESAAKLTPMVLDRFFSIKPLPQHDADASYCKKIEKSDGVVEFDDAGALWNRYRAFVIWPGIFLQNGLKLKKLDLVESQSQNEPGEILRIDESGVTVGCRRGSVRIERVQPPSKKEMSAIEYIRGRRIGVGDRFF